MSSNSPLSLAAKPVSAVVEKGIVHIDGFLPETQCHRILQELESATWEPSLTYEPQEDGSYLDVVSPHRVGRSAYQESFGRGMMAELSAIEGRLQEVFGVDPAYLEQWHAADYRRNGKFGYHLDAGYLEEDAAGERILTFLLYLNTPLQGGATHFPQLDRYVDARAGRLVVWENLLANGECNPDMIHAGTPVRKGRKTTLVTWQRQRPYRGSPRRRRQKGRSAQRDSHP